MPDNNDEQKFAGKPASYFEGKTDEQILNDPNVRVGPATLKQIREVVKAPEPEPSAETTDEPEADEPEGDPATYGLVLTRPAALGAGDRKPGTKLAELVVAPGVELTEALTAIRNPHLVELSKR